MVLDRDLPGVPGDEVCRQVVAGSPQTRVLMLTAASTVRDRVDGLGLGADDYLPKPFDFAELTARVRALGRRSAAALPPILECGDLTLDPNRRAASRAGRRLELSPKEFALLECLLASAGRVVPAEELLERVWDEAADPFTTAVKTTVRRLRGKLGDPPVIHTERERRLPPRRRPDARHLAAGARCGSSWPWSTPRCSRAPAIAAAHDPVPGLQGARSTRGPRAARPRRSSRAPTCSTRSPGPWSPWRSRCCSSLAAGWLMAGRLLRPVRAITAAAREISASNLHRRLRPGRRGDEFTELAETLNDLFGRLEASFDVAAAVRGQRLATNCAPRSPRSGPCSR